MFVFNIQTIIPILKIVLSAGRSLLKKVDHKLHKFAQIHKILNLISQIFKTII